MRHRSVTVRYRWGSHASDRPDRPDRALSRPPAGLGRDARDLARRGIHAARCAPTGSAPLLGVELYLKLEGANPTGSFKDRGMTMALSKAAEDGATAGRVRVDRQHVGVGRRLRRARRASRAWSSCRAARPRSASSPRRRRVGATRVRRSTGRSTTVCGWCASSATAIRSRSSTTSTTTASRGRRPRRSRSSTRSACRTGSSLPVGNAGNITAYWRGFNEAVTAGDATDRPRLLGCQAAGAAAMLQDTDIARARHRRDGDPDRLAGAPHRGRAGGARVGGRLRGGAGRGDPRLVGPHRPAGGRLLRAVERRPASPASRAPAPPGRSRRARGWSAC